MLFLTMVLVERYRVLDQCEGLISRLWGIIVHILLCISGLGMSYCVLEIEHLICKLEFSLGWEADNSNDCKPLWLVHLKTTELGCPHTCFLWQQHGWTTYDGRDNSTCSRWPTSFGSLVFEYEYSRIQIRENVVRWMLVSVNSMPDNFGHSGFVG
jgi:hypothetical protein